MYFSENLDVKSVMSSIYFCSYCLNLEDGTFYAIKNTDHIAGIIKDISDSKMAFTLFLNLVVNKHSKEEMREFLNLNTLSKRLKSKNLLECEYESNAVGWCKAYFFPLYEDGKLTKAIFAVQNINEQKEKELQQMKLLKQQNEIVDALAKKYYLICFLDLKKNDYKFLSTTKQLNEMLKLDAKKNNGFNEVIDTFVDDEYKIGVHQFLDVNTICQRMKSVNRLSMEYIDRCVGLCKLEINIISRDNSKIPSALLITSRIIEDENDDNNSKSMQLLIDNERMKKLINIDPLTGLLNRRAYEEITNSLRTKQTIGLMIVDVDCFKKINDDKGHIVGDAVLKRTAELLKTVCRSTDYLFRFGGDEFVIIFRNSPDINKKVITNKIKSINEEINNVDKESLNVSVSAGVAFSNDGFSEELFKHADDALYYVKNHGRQSVQFYDAIQKMESEQKNQITLQNYDSKEVFNAENSEKTLNEYKSTVINLLRKNKAVGIITMQFVPGLPIVSTNEFVFDSYGYNYDSFIEACKFNFINLVHPDERDLFMKCLNNNSGEIKLRIISRAGDYYWTNVCYEKFESKTKEQMVMASIKVVNNDVLGSLCEMDYQVIGIIDCKNREITIEKKRNSKDLYNEGNKTKYNFDDLLIATINSSIKPNERDAVRTNNSIEYIKERLCQNEIYENIVNHIDEYGNEQFFRHKYRYFNKQRDLILYSEENVTFWAEIDDVTGTQNRSGFIRSTKFYLENLKDEEDYSIVLFDIKGFKMINSIYGQQKGNEFLKSFARSLKKSNLKPIYIARLFADIFVCLVKKKYITHENIMKLCDQSILLKNEEYNIELCCGIYNLSKKEKEYDILSMIDKAKLAMSYIENMSLKPYCIFNENMNREYKENVEINSLLSEAIDNNEFNVFYQPVYDVKTRKIASAEALVRWNSKKKGLISPAKFIPILEKNGTISKLDLFVEKEVVFLLENRIFNKLKTVPISMNLSRQDFVDKEIIEEVFNTVNNSAIDNFYLRYEITESSFYEIGERGIDVLEKLRAKGSKVLLDDFGTGFSSLSSMTNQNFDVIKLDKSFIQKIGNSKRAEVVISSTIDLVHKLGSVVIAEGVENQEQYDFLLNVGCDYIQGYYFSKPINKEQFITLLDKE